MDCKRECAKKIIDLDNRETKLTTAEQKLEKTINVRVEKIAQQKEKLLKRKYQKMETKYEWTLFMAVMYGVVVTIFKAMTTSVIRNDIRGFFNEIISSVMNAEDLVSAILGMLFFCAVFGVIGYLGYTMRDKLSVSVSLGILALLIFLGDIIREYVPMNIVAMYFLLWIAYVIVRAMMKKEQ